MGHNPCDDVTYIDRDIAILYLALGL